MASQYSILHNYAPYVSPYNMDLVAKGMAYKQEKADTNRAYLQSKVSQFANLDLMKPEDQEYVSNRINYMLDKINSTYANADLAAAGTMQNIDMVINQVQDIKVQNAVAGTMEARKMIAYLDDIKLNHPEKYATPNEWAAMQPYYNWLNDGTAGSRMGKLNYTPYTDYRANADKRMKEFRTVNKGKSMQVPDGNGYLVETKVDQMTDEQVKQMVANSLTAQERAQIAIDGQYTAAMNPDLFNFENTTAFIQNTTSKYDQQIDALTAQLQGVGDDKVREQQIKAAISLAENRKREFATRVEGAMGDSFNPYLAGQIVTEQRFLDGMADQWSYDNNSVKYTNDASFYSKLNYQRNLVKDEIDAAYKKSMIELNESRKADYYAKAASRNGRTAGAATGMPTELGGVVIEGMATELQDYNPSAVLQSDIKNASDQLSTGARFILNSLPEDALSQLNAIMVEMKKNPNYIGLDDQALLLAYFNDNGGPTNGYLSSNPDLQDAYQSMFMANQRLEMTAQAIDKVKQYAKNTILSNDARRVWRDVGINNSKLPIYLPDGTKTSASAALRNGITFNPNISTEDMMIASAIGDKLASSLVYPGVETRVTTGGAPLVGRSAGVRGDKIYDIDNLGYLSTIGDLLGERLTPEQLFTQDENGNIILIPRSANDSYGITLVKSALEEGMKVAPSPTPGERPGLFGTRIGAGDDKWQEDMDIERLFNRAYNKKQAGEIANQYIKSGRLPQAYGFNLAAPAKSAQKGTAQILDNLFTNLASSDAKELREKAKGGVKFALVPGLEDNGITKWSIVVNGDVRTATSVPATTLIQNGININEAETSLKVSNLNPIEKPVSWGTSTNSNYGEMLLANGIPQVATKQDSKQVIDMMAAPLYKVRGADGIMQDSGAQDFLHTLIDNSEAFSVELSGNQSNRSSKVVVNVYDKSEPHKTRKPLASISYTGEEYADQYVNLMGVAPQYYYIQALLKNINMMQATFGNSNKVVPTEELMALMAVIARNNGSTEQPQ